MARDADPVAKLDDNGKSCTVLDHFAQFEFVSFDSLSTRRKPCLLKYNSK